MLAFTLAALAGEPAPPAWLAGCWTAPMGGGSLTETWLGPHGGVMVGAALGGDPAKPTWEHLRLAVIDGALTLVASPAGQATTSFKATSVRADALVFENPAHDFPQRITYARAQTGLTARVEARDGDGWRGFTLAFSRCPASGLH